MTHPTPTAATRASSPPRGEGMGAGGLALAFTLALTTPALAQIIPTGTPAADILLSQAITEQRVFLTCSSLDSLSHPLITQGWQADAAAAIATLTANNVAPEAIAAFTEAARPENLLPADDTPFADVRQFCDAHPDWQTTLYQFGFTLLDRTLPKAFE
ncbi:hypothetical protein [Tabrizicola sp.]|uniref:hypothetical protein n=1 Tax=Tabrizicola sp. TaxID=2005166 RepID=UPI002603EBEC|nr:hypothetical protein [Tabrizicola sp.]MDM7932958.1 hypothetical protein [Tabrizicola sp.]